MAAVYTIGELLVEIMRTEMNVPLSSQGLFAGPYPSGAPAIFIDALAKLGVSCGIIGAVGSDPFGRCIVDRLANDGVSCSHIRQLEHKTTGMAFVTYFEDGTRDFLFHLRDSAATHIESAMDLEFIKAAKALHLSGSSIAINESVRELCLKAARMVKASGGLVTFDPNIRLSLLGDRDAREFYEPFLHLTDVLLPSEGELELVTGIAETERALEYAFGAGIKAVVQKLGAQGCVLYREGDRTAAHSFCVDAVDPTGAGDCFAAGIIYGLLESLPWSRILTLANALGALATTKLGPMEGCTDLQTVNRFIEEQGTGRL